MADQKNGAGVAIANAAAPALADTIERWEDLLRAASQSLAAMDPARAEEPIRDEGWSRKQVLGHTIDSASNNHQRFVRAQILTELVWPNYDQEPWVESQGYSAAPWDDLVEFWTLYNKHLLRVVRRIPEEKTTTVCRIGDEAPMTLAELIASYVRHLEHHLKQILA